MRWKIFTLGFVAGIIFGVLITFLILNNPKNITGRYQLIAKGDVRSNYEELYKIDRHTGEIWKYSDGRWKTVGN